ncbi:MFS transporter [Streptomyces sp. NEAU-Y11]|uniref:MFS transporter n=1 Tax=Streptomyces cucumeris TaxID=2962890 RepID=UPI0020C929F7|nr:MFS transporter [Streptomyces sp. NEAU-Y11]MCP9208710.1 MFS transporter [Streptomyces sp. NEAU-Y11]
MNDQRERTGWLLAVALTVQFVVALDMSVVNVALPDIRDDLGFDPGGLLWVVNAYALAFGGLLMLGGRLADIVGRRTTLMAGLAVFGLASLGGGLVGSPGWLIAARAVQGVGAAALAPVAFTLIAVTFPAGPARARALGLWGMAAAAGGAVGVLAGGLLTAWAGWRSVLLINVPIVLAALAAARFSVAPDRREGPPARLDAAGALLVTGGMTALVLALVRTGTHPWGSPATLTTLAVAAVALLAFVVVERRVAQPLLRIGLLRQRSVLVANLFVLLLFSGQFAAFYFTSLYMQQILEYGPVRAGTAFLPFCAGIVIGSLTATRTVARFGVRNLLVVGGLLGAAGFAWFRLTVGVDGGFADSVLGPSLVASVGIGLCVVPMGTAATTGVAAHEAGMASGLVNSSRQIGGSLGLAVLATVASQTTDADGGGGPAALVSGYATAFGVAGALLAVAALSAALLLPGRSPAEPPAEPSVGPPVGPPVEPPVTAPRGDRTRLP